MTEKTDRNFHAIEGPNGMCACGVKADGTMVTCAALLEAYVQERILALAGAPVNEEEIDDVICAIMMRDGPDRHVDGHRVITAFVVALLDGRGEEWFREYEARRRRPRA